MDAVLRRLSSVTAQSGQYPLASPVLRNHLSSLSLSIPSITSDTLLEPLRRRRRQLIEVSVHELQTKARSILVNTSGLMVAGIAASWWMYVPPVAALTAMSATALGILSLVGSIYLGQRRWNHAQSLFWQAWDRSTQMLKGDLQASALTFLSRRRADYHSA